MPVSRDFEERVLGALRSVAPVTAKRMFGGLGLYCGGPIFAVVDDDRLYFKVDDQTVADYDAAGSEAWVYDAKVGPIAKYRELPAYLLDDPAELGRWVADAAEAAMRLAKGAKR